MAADRVIRVILSGDSRGAVRAFAEADAAASKTQGKLERMKNVGSGMSSVGRSMASMSLPLVALGGIAVKSAATFQSSMEMIHTQAGASQAEVTRMSKSLQSIAPSVGTGPNELAQGLYHIESNGLRGARALDALKVAAEGARVGNANLEDVTNALGAAIAGGVVKAGDYSAAMGSLNAAVGAGDMRMQDMADALGTGLLGPMKTYGVSLRSVSAALAVFGDNNIRGAEAGTRLTSAIRIMAAPSSAAAKALAGIGITQTQLADDLHKPNGLVAAMQDLKAHLKASGLTASQQALVITRAFGGRQSTGVQLMLGQLGRLQTKYQQAGTGANKFGSDVTAYNKTAAAQWNRLKATADTALIGIGNAILPIVTQFLPKLAHLVQTAASWFTHLSTPVKTAIIAFTAFLAIGGPILMFIGSLIGAIASIGTALEFLAANPIVLIIAAVVAFVAGLVYAYEKVAWFHNLVDSVFHAIATVVSTVVQFIGQHWQLLLELLTLPIGGALAWIVTHFNQIVAFFSGIISQIAGVFAPIGPFIAGIFQSVVNGIIAGINFVIRALDTVIRQYDSVAGSIPFLGGSLKVGTIGQIGNVNLTGNHHRGGASGGGYRLQSRQAVGSQTGNSINQSGHSANNGGGAGGEQPIVLHHTTRLGGRVVTEETVHYAAKRNSLGAAVLAH